MQPKEDYADYLADVFLSHCNNGLQASVVVEMTNCLILIILCLNSIGKL